MKIQIKQIKGDIVELVFNPREVDLRVGENLTLRENGSDRGLIIQVIEFRTVTYPSLLQEMLQLVVEDSLPGRAPEPKVVDPDGLPEMGNLKLAIAKIRKVVQWSRQMVVAHAAGS